ncbi:CPCC family cysteine-rich protein [Paenibacillus wenxiniae]|uniref:CPCC family cysteine-rich protein n=1 Tax=Paenibacillus wenxiniae TaxID=1636843 RepID=A0ABW4RL66_9BACL
MKNISREHAVQFISSLRNLVEKEMEVSTYIQGFPEKDLEMDEDDFKGVSNGFLSEIIYFMTGRKVEVIGEVENLFPCPCCGFKTLTERYDKNAGTGYEICSYCTWEDDGTVDPHAYRSINKGSMIDYRNEMYRNPNKYDTSKWIKTEKE